MKIQKAFSRIFSTATLAGLLGITGCDNTIYPRRATNETEKVEYATPHKNDKPCEFTNFGYVPWSYERSYSGAAVAVGDMDGDGDLDIVTLSSSGGIVIHENKIPQRK